MNSLEATVDVVRHLRRLERASSAVDIVKELQHLGPSLGAPRYLETTQLPVLAALAEAHLRDRLEPARDALTGLHDARAWNELFQAHARNATTSGGEAIAVMITLTDAADPRFDREVAAYLRMLASACTTSVAEGDYVGRVGCVTLAVLPRHGGLRGAQSVAARLADCCREVFGATASSVRIDIELKDATGQSRERRQIGVEPSDAR